MHRPPSHAGIPPVSETEESPTRAPRRRPKIGLGRFLFLPLSLVFLWDAALMGRAYVFRDVVTFFQPWQHAVRESIRAGHVPLWNHDTFCGIPLLANLQSGVLYPINWLYSAIPFDFALTLGMVLHLTLAGILMRGFLSRVGLANPSAFLGGVLFAYGTWTMSYLEFPMKLGAAIWLPLLWSGLWDAVRLGRRRGLAWSALAVALSLLAGYPQITLFALISGSLFALFLMPGVFRNQDLAEKERTHRVGAWPVALGIGVLVAAAQLLPAAEMMSLSSKAAPYDANVAMTRSLSPLALVGLFDPFFLGFPGIDRYWGGEIVEFSGGALYVGVLSLVLVASVLPTMFPPRNRRRRRKDDKERVTERAVVWFLATGVVVGILIALGKHTPLYPFLHSWVPGFGRSRWPSTACFLVVAHLAPLAAIGMQTLLVDTARVRKASWGALGLGAALIAAWFLAWGPGSEFFRTLQLSGAPPFQAKAYEATRGAWLNVSLIRALLVLAAGGLGFTLGTIRSRFVLIWTILIAVDLFVTGKALEAPTGRGFYDRVPASVAEIAEELEGHRVFTPRSTDQLGNFLYGGRNLTSFEWARQSMLCNANIPMGIEQAHGCEPLNPRRHEAFVQAFSADETPWAIKERIFDFWDAGLLITVPNMRPLDIPNLKNPGHGVELSRHEPQLGRAMLMSGWETVGEGGSMLEKLLSPQHDPGAWTLIEPTDGSPPLESATRSPTTPGEEMLYEAGPNSIRVAWHLGEAGMLRILESWAPGWEAKVNGVPAPVYRADFLFMAVPVPAGSCEVELTYRPKSFRDGSVASGVGLAALLLCFFTGRKGKAKKHGRRKTDVA